MVEVTITYPVPGIFVFASGIAHPLISPLTGDQIGNLSFSHDTGTMTVSRPIGKLRYSGPERVESATPHLLCY